MYAPSLQHAEILSEGFLCKEHIVSCFHRGYDEASLAAIGELPAALEPGMSIAVCTHDRAASLNRFLDSLLRQNCKPEQLIIVDASSSDKTEGSLRRREDVERLAKQFIYCRVRGPLKGLTRQRNFALRWVTTDLVAFFDDDIVLSRQCLSEMRKAHMFSGRDVVGVAAYIENDGPQMSWLMRQRLLFRVVPDCTPGKYHPSGVSIGWGLTDPQGASLESDWLPGGVTMWKTAVARDEGFCESFNGYSPGEDLDFSLRMRKRGKLLMVYTARVKHLHEPSGRPNHYVHGYMGIYNLFTIHRQQFAGRYLCWFIYAWMLDTVFLSRHFLFPSRFWATLQHILGRLAAAFDIVVNRRSF